MRPTHFPESNRTLTAPPGMDDCEDLPVWTDGTICASRWELSDEERQAIADGAPVWLVVHAGGTHAPVSLDAAVTIFENSPRNN